MKSVASHGLARCRVASASASVHSFTSHSLAPSCQTVALRKRLSHTCHGIVPVVLYRHARYATTTAATASKSKPYRSTANLIPAKPLSAPVFTLPIPAVRAQLNPPLSTYAPELIVPPRKQDQNFLKYVWQCGRSYVAFYKQGIKNVRSTAKLAKTLRQKKAAAPPSERESILTRAEWQVVRRSRSDVLRLPPFAALALIFGEWLPLFVMFLTPIIPEPCRIPSQISRKLKKMEERRQMRERRMAMDSARIMMADRKAGTAGIDSVRPQAVRPEEVEKMGVYNLLRLSIMFDCHGRVWDWSFATPPRWFLRLMVKKQLAYVQRDDHLIRRDGGWQGLDLREIERACMERGIAVLGRPEAELRKALTGWFRR